MAVRHWEAVVAMVATPRRDRDRRGGQWRVSVQWTEYLLPNAATIAEYTAALDGLQLHLPATPVAAGYPNAVVAELLVEAPTLRGAVTTGLARVEKAVGCTARGVHAVRVPAATLREGNLAGPSSLPREVGSPENGTR
jgi:hypothetical protein